MTAQRTKIFNLKDTVKRNELEIFKLERNKDIKKQSVSRVQGDTDGRVVNEKMLMDKAEVMRNQNA